MLAPHNNHATTETQEQQALRCRRRVSDRKWKKAAKRPVQIYKVAALALLRALLKGDEAVGGTCVWWESQNPADSLVSPERCTAGNPCTVCQAVCQAGSVYRHLGETTCCRRTSKTEILFALLIYLQFILVLGRGQGCHFCCVKHGEMFPTATQKK